MDSTTLALRAEFAGSWRDDLVSHYEQLLAEAEQLYGERNRSWRFLGVQVGEFEGVNRTWPIDKDRKLACICLQKLSGQMPDFLYFNLAHETIHMLSPPDAHHVTYLEEGVAVSFSLSRTIYGDARFVEEQLKIFEKFPDDKYTIAWKDVQRLIKAEPNVIAELRLQNKSLSCISASQIIDAAPRCDKVVAERLSRRFLA